MIRKTRGLPLVACIVVLGLVLVAGCQRTDVMSKSAVEGDDGEEVAATTGSTAVGATSSSSDGVEVRAGDGKAVVKSGDVEVSAGNGKARVGDVVAGDGEARVGDVVAESGAAKGDKKGSGAGYDRVNLKIGGKGGTSFSGSCKVGEEVRKISGQVPERIVYKLGDRNLECEIRREGADDGQLKWLKTRTAVCL
ncbi:hypothetical protein BH23ACT11_BH23ACT11_10000 [soil metagenome]